MVAMHGRRRRDERERNGIEQRDRGRTGGRHRGDLHHDDDEGRDAGASSAGAREGASGALRSVVEGAQSIVHQIGETTGEVAGSMLDTVLDEAERLYRKQKKPALSRIAGLSKMADRTAHALHAVKADGVAEYVEQAADQVGTITEYLEDRSLSEILEDAGDIVQRNRAVAMGGMFVVGFALVRFLNATESRDGAGGDAGEDDDQGDEEREAEDAPRKQRRRGR